MIVGPIRRISVMGAGQMGHQIAMLCALGDFETILYDLNENQLVKAEETLQSLMDQWVQKGKINEEEKSRAFNRLSFTADLEKAAESPDLVIEAVVEKLTVKKELFQALEGKVPDHTIFATNSSTIVNSLLAPVTSRPDKFVNMHFFFPPLVMNCVEVVMSEETSEETAQAAMQVCEQINRRPFLLRKEISGFVANRILGAIHKEALHLYEEGIADFQDIDQICRTALGHPIGPFELLDLSGNDVIYYVMQQRYEETGDVNDKPNESIIEKVQKGKLGRKTGSGWYEYGERRGKLEADEVKK